MAKTKTQYMTGHEEYAGDGVDLAWTDYVTRHTKTAKRWLEYGLYVSAIHDSQWGEEGAYEVCPGDMMYGHEVTVLDNGKLDYYRGAF